MPGPCENHLYVSRGNEQKYDLVPEAEVMPESDGSGSDPLMDSDSFSGGDEAPGDENHSVNQNSGNHHEMSEEVRDNIRIPLGITVVTTMLTIV